jgi:hypothetical protein
MKRFVLVILAVVLINSFATAQEATRAGQVGLQTALVFTRNSTGNNAGDIGAKFMLTNNIALRAALGALYSDTNSTLSADMGVGIEFHFGGKGGVSPYAGVECSFSTIGSSVGSPSNDVGLSVAVGGEYFFSSNFSWAGETRLGFDRYNASGSTTMTVGTYGFATFLTWYLN